MTGGMAHNPSHRNVCKFVKFHFSTYIFPADVTPNMLKLCKVRGTKLKVLSLFLVPIFIQFNFNTFKSIAAILEKGLLTSKID